MKWNRLSLPLAEYFQLYFGLDFEDPGFLLVEGLKKMKMLQLLCQTSGKLKTLNYKIISWKLFTWPTST